MMPLISVIMPAYNCEKYIRQAIDSILNQTYSEIELLIADDCSKDSTRKIIESYTDPRIKLFHNTQNMGYLKTCNKLLSLASGELLAFQDADDLSLKNRLQEQYNFLLQNPSIAVVGCNMLYINEEDEEMYCSAFEADGKNFMAQMAKEDYAYSPNTFLFKRTVLEKVGVYHEYFDRVGAEDFYWTIIILRHFIIATIKPALYCYRMNQNSITADYSDNPKKMATAALMNKLILQQIETGTDDLEQKNIEVLDNFTANFIAPYTADHSLFLHTLAVRSFYKGRKKQAIKFLLKAIAHKPFRIAYYKDLVYFLFAKNQN